MADLKNSNMRYKSNKISKNNAISNMLYRCVLSLSSLSIDSPQEINNIDRPPQRRRRAPASCQRRRCQRQRAGPASSTPPPPPPPLHATTHFYISHLPSQNCRRIAWLCSRRWWHLHSLRRNGSLRATMASGDATSVQRPGRRLPAGRTKSGGGMSHSHTSMSKD